jgi:hypothetical protein
MGAAARKEMTLAVRHARPRARLGVGGAAMWRVTGPSDELAPPPDDIPEDGFTLLQEVRITRALNAGRAGNPIGDGMGPHRLYGEALLALEKDYRLIGPTKNIDLGCNALCAIAGPPPARKIPAINATRLAGHPDLELPGTRDILASLTRIDHVIYDRARQLFDRRHRQAAETYDTAAFEADHAARPLGKARGFGCDGATRLSVRVPVVGSGFHGRVGSGMPSRAIWSGAEAHTTL